MTVSTTNTYVSGVEMTTSPLLMLQETYASNNDLNMMTISQRVLNALPPPVM